MAIGRVSTNKEATSECVCNHSSSFASSSWLRWRSESSSPFGVLLVEAKKKKNEVLPVQNSPATGHGGKLGPINMP